MNQREITLAFRDWSRAVQAELEELALIEIGCYMLATFGVFILLNNPDVQGVLLDPLLVGRIAYGTILVAFGGLVSRLLRRTLWKIGPAPVFATIAGVALVLTVIDHVAVTILS